MSRPCSAAVPEVTFARQALASLRGCDAFLRPRNAAVADALLAEIDATCNLIAAFPGMGRLDRPSGLQFHVTRKYRYRIICRAVNETVEILDVLHPSRR